MKKILFCGTTNLDYFIYGKSLPTEGVTIKGHFEQNSGGKGANQAVACSNLKQPFFILDYQMIWQVNTCILLSYLVV